jgi:hypothetical protein
MAKPNIQNSFIPNSLLVAAKSKLGSGFNDLPKRLQLGYLSLFLGNRYITKSNQHKLNVDSFKIGVKDLTQLFGEYQRFMDINFNGYYMKPRQTNSKTGQGDFCYCRCDDNKAQRYNPLMLVKQTYQGHPGSTDSDSGLLSAYKLSDKVQKIIEDWIDFQHTYRKDIRYMTDLKGNRIDVKDLTAKGIVRRRSSTSDDVNIRKMVNVSFVGLFIYRCLLKDLYNHASNHGDKVTTKDGKKDRVLFKRSKYWNVAVNQMIEQDKVSEKSCKELSKYKGPIKSYTRIQLQEIQQEIVNRIAVREAQITKEEEGRGRKGPKQGKEPSLVIGKVTESLSKPLYTLLQKDLSLLSINSQLHEIENLMAIILETNTNNIPVAYKECGTGRYFAFVIQGYHKEVRCATLKGCFAYDIEAAHQNILVQMMDRSDISFPELDVIREYVENKESIRVGLANELNVTVDVVKGILQILTYGSRLSESKQEALYEQCNEDIEIIRKVKGHPWMVRYRKAFDLSFDKYIGNEKRVVNAVGIKIDRSKSSKSQKMAHVLQGYEVEILDTLMNESEFGFIKLLLHDCVVFGDRVDPNQLSEAVKEKTGFSLSFKEEKY